MKMAIKTATLLSVRIGACSHLTEMNGSMTVFSRNCENYAEIHVFFFSVEGGIKQIKFPFFSHDNFNIQTPFLVNSQKNTNWQT